MFSRVSRTSGTQLMISTHAPEILADEGIGLDEVLVLVPSPEGTTGHLARDIPDVAESVKAGLSMEDAVISHTVPRDAGLLALFG